ncbi:MAG: hypothetical protein KAT09_08780 [Candidatus Aegiribacteria sp.]|nr:hypothetical protein [Candidatus Aegiribacteria sp.]
MRFDYSWQVLRRANAFSSEAVLDGERSEGEYREPFHTNFADYSGQPAPIPETESAAATDGEKLFIFMEIASQSARRASLMHLKCDRSVLSCDS